MGGSVTGRREGFIIGFVKMLSTIVPHVGQELWEILGQTEELAYAKWPEYDESLTKDSSVTYAVSVNGKLREKLVMPLNCPKEEVEKEALASPKIKTYTDGHEIVKIIVVPNKIVNIVIK